MEKRGGAPIDVDRHLLEVRMRDYFDSSLLWDEYKARRTALTKDAAAFDAPSARTRAVIAESFDAKRR